MRIAMWVAAAVFAGLLFVWAAGSGWAYRWAKHGAFSVQVGNGVLEYEREVPPAPSLGSVWFRPPVNRDGTPVAAQVDWTLRRTQKPFRWWLESVSTPGVNYRLSIPIWPAVVVSLLVFGGLALDRGRHLATGMQAIARWGLTCATLLIALAWFMSIWWSANWSSNISGERAGMWCGRVWVVRGVPKARQPAEQLVIARFTASRMHWWFEYGKLGTMMWLYVPLWAPLLVAGAGAYGLWRKRMRETKDPKRCTACGYHLAGLAKGAMCPECGAIAGVQK
jgi:hypothetical protein